ncbi:MAG: right-handed parallel beta-helix repeat-containing protein [Spirochaetes bacterium]|nr:right-handed parallel beta-helix repeat-containing protein [Spirochaetota bacterium]
MKKLCAFMLAFFYLSAVEPPAGFFMEHGIYSAAYMSDWSKLGTGKDIAKKDLNAFHFTDVNGTTAKEKYENMSSVYLTNKAVRVSWSIPADKYKTTMFYIRECKEVIVDRLAVIQNNADNAGSQSLFIEDCDVVVVKNSYFAGAVNQVHLRIENCGYVFIDGVEIAGIDYSGNGKFRNGAGIFVEGGQMDSSGKLFRRYSSNARDIQWLTIQNCYIHDYTFGDKWENKDGIQLHSVPNGTLFNCFVENWDMKYADGAIDVSHRRTDLSNRVFRIERNIIYNCSLTKSPGTGTADDAVVWVNNIFINAFYGDYHHGWKNVFLHNTWLYDDPHANVHYKLWGFDGPAQVMYSLIVSPHSMQMIFQNADGGVEKYREYYPQRNVYALAQTTPWLVGVRKEKLTYDEWRAMGKDEGSMLLQNSGSAAITRTGDTYSISSRSPAAQFSDGVYTTTNDARYRVSRDFNGKTRPMRPTAGAIEAQ